MKSIVVTAVTMLMYVTVLSQQASTSDSATALSDSSRPELLGEVVVRSKRPFLQVLPDKIVVNVEAGITNTGSTLLEVLEKSPGVTIDRNGAISLKGRQGVLIMIDGKPANVGGADLGNLLSGMAAAQVDQIEIIDNPSSKYDAAGNAGVINIKTKKNRERGFNGNLNLSLAQGKYTRSFNSTSINYNSGKFNLFSNLTFNYNRNFSNLYASRQYYADDNSTIISMLEQPSFFNGRAPSQTVKAGVDYFVNRKTTIGIVMSETSYRRRGSGNNTAIWKDAQGNTDSIIKTQTRSRESFNNFMVNLNARHVFSAEREITADFDYLGYRIRVNQFFNNSLQAASGYSEDLLGNLPSNLNIVTGKADYTHSLKNGVKIEAGWKSSHISTNNKAEYFLQKGSISGPDYDKTNHFIYKENIHAVYGNFEKKLNKFLINAGVRYENTSYDANQLGNIMRKDSSFRRQYDGLFPTITTSLEIDSNQTISFTMGRRIDRPPFQSLNPFIFVINKYTYESGNPFYRPQYTWNFEVSHTFKNKVVSSLNYSRTSDYFSQIFVQDSTGIITYTVGNLDFMENYGASLSLQTSITPWWSVSAFTALNYKKIRGVVWKPLQTARLQANFNVNNQFTFAKTWSAELIWVQQLHEQELQEITDPSGQVGVGIGKQLFKNKGSIKIAYRDIFYTMWMKGFTEFEQSTEYFKITRDTRAVSLAFTYRFGSGKRVTPRSTGGASEEMERVGQ